MKNLSVTTNCKGLVFFPPVTAVPEHVLMELRKSVVELYSFKLSKVAWWFLFKYLPCLFCIGDNQFYEANGFGELLS